MASDMGMNKYFTPNFFMIWWQVQHELDLFDEGEESGLSKNNYESGKKWLDENRDLAEKYFIG